MQVEIKVDISKLSWQIHELAKAVKVVPGIVMKQETKELIKSIWSNTPPRTKAQGENAIVTDLFGGAKGGGSSQTVGLFQKIGASELKKSRGDATFTVGVNLGWEKSKTIRIMRKFWRPDANIGTMQDFHKQYQNKKTGRTGRVTNSQIGRWKVQDQMWVKNSVAGAYLRDLKKRVGWAKGAFEPAYDVAGGTAPGWISRHGNQAGTVSFNWGENPYIKATGLNVKIPNYQRMVSNAVKHREKIMARKMNRLRDGLATNLGFKVVEART